MPLLQKRVHFWLAGAIADHLMRLWAATWRVTIVDPESATHDAGAARKQGIFSFWHQHILTVLCAYRGGRFCVPVSEHRDGEYIAQVMERYGLLAVRGSTTRGSLKLLRGLLGAVTAGWSIAITPDGPKGPKFSVQPGFIMLARRTGLPVYPVGVAVDRAWTLGSWDAFVVPKPFTRTVVRVGDAITPEQIAAGSTEVLCQRLKDGMAETTESARRVLERG